MVKSTRYLIKKQTYEQMFINNRTSLVDQTVKRLPTTWETQVQSLGWEDLLEKEMATNSSILAWKINNGIQENS